MRKKILITLFSLALVASLVCGCGNKANQTVDADTEPSTVESTEPSGEETSTAELETDTDPEESKESEGQSEAISTPDPTPIPEATPDTQESGEKPDGSEESPQESSAAASAPEETTMPVAENAVAETPTEQAASYTVTEMSATMYVKNAVNLRQGPGTEYVKVGNLAKGQQVTVTGQAENGWYRLDSGAFVSNKYLTDTAPAQQGGTLPNTSADQTGTVIPVGTDTESFGGTSVEFINYLNQQRTALGLSALVWDDNLAAVAQRRAQELTVDNSHNGCPADCSEIIYMGGSSYTDWYNAWYNSQDHRENMFREDHGTAACAYYYQNYNYYVVTLFKQREKTQEELDEIMNPDNMIQIGENVYIDRDSYEALINSGIDPSAEPDEEVIKQLEEQQKLLEQGIIDRVFE